MPTTIAPYGWPVPLIGEAADGPDMVSDLGTAISATLTDTTVQTYTPAWTADGTQPGSLAAVQGRYRVDHGICDFTVYLGFGSGTTGGTLGLHVGLPKAARADVQAQVVQCWLHAAVPAGVFMQGFANIPASAVRADPFFPAIVTQSNVAQWSNANASNAPGSGVPALSNTWSVMPGGWFIMSGRYFCVP